MPICAKFPIYLDRVVNQLIEQLCNNTKNHFCEVEIYVYILSTDELGLVASDDRRLARV